LTLISW